MLSLIEYHWRNKPINDKKTRLNNLIRVPEVRLIDEKGEQRGVMPTADALAAAKTAGLDLVEVSPNAEPPVCRILDYGKYQFEQGKKKSQAKKKQKKTQTKELKYSVRIEEGDYQVRLRNMIRFLDQGDKVKVSLRFRGREMAHQDLGLRLLERIQIDIEPYGDVEQKPKLDGRQVMMLVVPKKR